MGRGGCCNIWPDADDLGLYSQNTPCDALRRWPLHHIGLLVHGLHFVRKSCRHYRALSDTFAGIAPGGVLTFLAAQLIGAGGGGARGWVALKRGHPYESAIDLAVVHFGGINRHGTTSNFPSKYGVFCWCASPLFGRAI